LHLPDGPEDGISGRIAIHQSQRRNAMSTTNNLVPATETRSLSAEELQEVSGGCPRGSLPLIVAVAVMQAVEKLAKQ
jgi:hypothetical protein